MIQFSFFRTELTPSTLNFRFAESSSKNRVTRFSNFVTKSGNKITKYGHSTCKYTAIISSSKASSPKDFCAAGASIELCSDSPKPWSSDEEVVSIS